MASRIILSEIRCCVACFSAHFVVEELNILASRDRLIVGCCYLYDDVQVGDSIIDVDGISMKRVEENKAAIKWGIDSIYE